jgi:hypothetical protein
MTTLSIQDLGLRPAQLRALGSKAKREGKSPQEYVRTLVERDLVVDESFDEILKPVREDFRRSGITEGQLDEVVQKARKARSGGRRGARR